MMSFFVTSTGNGAMGGNFGGIAGADQKCQTLATGKGLGGKTWKAYLSVQGTNAKDRIGAGPWYNQKNKMVAADVAALHANNFNLAEADILDENGVAVPQAERGILTGSNRNGTANGNRCNNWTSNAGVEDAEFGRSDSSATNNTNDRWNGGGTTNGCAQNDLTDSNSTGRIYCFASN
jgi:hypothetical protein